MSEYRPNVAALLLNPEGKLLICERIDHAGAWQFPQGGVDEGESVKEALYREVIEEVGIPPGCYQIAEKQDGYRYDYPEAVRAAKPPRKARFRGQEQTYFLCRLTEDAIEPDIEQDHQEFSQFKWITPGEFQLEWLPDFKKEVHRQVFRDFFQVEL